MKPILTRRGTLAWIAAAIATFHVAWLLPGAEVLLGVAAYSLIQLTRQKSRIGAMNVGWFLGLALYGPHLHFFWTLFQTAAIALWLVLGFWLGLFLALTRFLRQHWGDRATAALIPVVWTGLEFFRSELYMLRFSWLSLGHVFAWTPGWNGIGQIGTFGAGFLLMGAASLVDQLSKRAAVLIGFLTLLALSALCHLPRDFGRSAQADPPAAAKRLRIVGIQLEFPDESAVTHELDRARQRHPSAELFVLPEYTLQGPPSDELKAWCRTHGKFLLVGGKAAVNDDAFYNTAFVAGPDGAIVFQQAKSRPIQFMKDGLPAPSQKVWDSPWGKIGICVCFDLSYTQVLDALARLGAQAILAPTMDVIDWGEYQHRLHSRLGPLRACEYAVPVVRVASSGISQIVDQRGTVISAAGFAHDGAIVSGELEFGPNARLPWDRTLVWPCVAITGAIATWAFTRACIEKRPSSAESTTTPLCE